ncbi:hypothetical protein ACKWTF_004240 [Chironomus riparius]
MKMTVVNRCLWLELETCGKILGWLGIIGAIFMLLVAGVALIILSLMSCKELIQIVQDEDLQDLLPEISITDCQIFTAVIIVAAILVIIYGVVSTIINTLLLIGIQKRDPGKIIPAVIIQGFATFTIIFRGLASFSIEGIITAVSFGIIAYLIFIVLYSLYVKIRKDHTPRYENQIIQICKA